MYMDESREEAGAVSVTDKTLCWHCGLAQVGLQARNSVLALSDMTSVLSMQGTCTSWPTGQELQDTEMSTHSTVAEKGRPFPYFDFLFPYFHFFISILPYLHFHTSLFSFLLGSSYTAWGPSNKHPLLSVQIVIVILLRRPNIIANKLMKPKPLWN